MLEVCAACPAVPHTPEEMFHLPGWKWHQPRCSRHQLCPLKGMVPALARQHLQPSVWAPVCALRSQHVPRGHSMSPDWQPSVSFIVCPLRSQHVPRLAAVCSLDDHSPQPLFSPENTCQQESLSREGTVFFFCCSPGAASLLGHSQLTGRVQFIAETKMLVLQ